jgi:hypothetical protein
VTNGSNDDNQLMLDFKVVEKAQPIEQKAPVVQFVDRATQKFREEAIRRVGSAGIFEISASYKSQ